MLVLRVNDVPGHLATCSPPSLVLPSKLRSPYPARPLFSNLASKGYQQFKTCVVHDPVSPTRRHTTGTVPPESLATACAVAGMFQLDRSLP